MTSVRGVLGMPYAHASRYERPSVAPMLDGAWDAFGLAAPQAPDADPLVPVSPVGPTSEDCLSLNVWTPAREGDAPRPVLVWVHGGGFLTGASRQPVYDGARFSAEQDVVVVTCNYRLGALGFLDTRAIGGDAVNLGLHDVRTALQWVQANIARFGGDPSRVTLFGESAGGGVTVHLLASAQARGLFRSAIVQSGVTDRTLSPDAAAVVTETLCAELGARDVDALCKVPLEAIVAAQTAVLPKLLPTVGMMPFHPAVDDDLLTAAPAVALAGGIAAGVPLIAGSTASELRLFLGADFVPPARDRLVTRVARYLGVETRDAEAIVGRYEAEVGPDEVWPVLFSDVEMQMPLRKVLDAQAPHASTYTYLFDWDAPRLGAVHGVDIPFTFGNFADGWAEFVGYDDAAERVSTELRTAWASFAREGKPGWDPYPTARIFARASSPVAPSHPAFGRLER